MISRKFKKISKRKPAFVNYIILIIVFTLVVVISIDLYIRPTVNKATSYQAKIIATELLSETTYQVLESMEIEYGSIVNITKNQSNEITAIETNMNTINKLKAKLTSDITKNLNNIKSKNYNISLGTLIGNDFLMGRGPDITFKIEPVGYLQTELISQFTSVGINQTQHQILLNMTVDMSTIIPFHNSDTVVNTKIIIAETIIVGDVPQYYTNVISDDKNLISDINDYNMDVPKK